MNKISGEPQFQILGVNQTGCTKFPTKKQFICLFILSLFELQAIIIKIPFQLNNLDLTLLIAEIILVTIILISWYSTLAIHPGPKNDIRQFQFTSAEQIIKKTKNNSQLQQNQFQICKICKLKKDSQIQHCRKCNRCVLNYYFHISWLNTCIGKQNFPSFLSLIVFTFLYQLLLLVSNFVILLENKRDNLFQPNNKFMILKGIINKIFIGLLVILIIGTIIVLLLKKNKLKKHKRQLKNKLKQNNHKIERKLNKERTQLNNQHFTETVVQTDSIKQLQFHENTLHSLQIDQPSLFKTNFFSSSNYFNHKKQSVEVKAQMFQNQLNLQDSKSKYARSMKSHSRQYSDSFQAQNMRLEQLIQIQKIKQHKLEIKTSKFCQQKTENKVQISLDLIKTKPKLQIMSQQLSNQEQKFCFQNKQLKNQKKQLCSPAQLGYKVIKGKRKSISKLQDPIQKGKKKQFNLFTIRKKDSFNDFSKEEFHRISKMSN